MIYRQIRPQGQGFTDEIAMNGEDPDSEDDDEKLTCPLRANERTRRPSCTSDCSFWHNPLKCFMLQFPLRDENGEFVHEGEDLPE